MRRIDYVRERMQGSCRITDTTDLTGGGRPGIFWQNSPQDFIVDGYMNGVGQAAL
jgi:hypothetical protein